MPETYWKKSQTRVFLDTSATEVAAFIRLGKSTVFDLSLNAKTETQDFIEDDMPTEMLDYYKPELPVEYVLAEGDAGFDALWDMFEALKVGSDAIRKTLIVFPKVGTVEDTFRAWQMNATVVFTNLTTTDKKLKLSLYFGGSVAHGAVAIADGVPTFTEDA